uniref:Kinesin motor domain-containing protein n=1 Tax=Mesocestoides corti TaxID=53468 RepID=A0A5K3F6T4_MESCO
SGVTDSKHIGVNPLVEGEKHAKVATSCDRGCDFRLCGVTRALNDAPDTENQFFHEIFVSIAAPRNGRTGEQDKDI